MPKMKPSVRFLPLVMIAVVLIAGCSEISNAIEAQAALDRGYDFAIDGDLDSAFIEFEKAIELDANFAATYDARGTAFLERGRLDRAIADYDKAIELDPDVAIYYADRGLAHLRSAEVDLAISDFKKAIELDDNDSITALAYRNLGETYMVIGLEDRAIDNFQEVLKISDDPNLRKEAEDFLESLGAAP